METADMRAPRIRAPRGALNPEGIKCEKNWQVLRITAGQFHVFLKYSRVFIRRGGALRGQPKGWGEATTSTAAAVIANCHELHLMRKRFFKSSFPKFQF